MKMNEKLNSIILAGGGTAGHIVPNIALINDLKEKFNNIYYIATKNDMAIKFLENYPFVKYIGIDAVKFDRVHLLKNVLIPFKLFKSVLSCKKIIKNVKPDIIFTKGGYVSLPVVLAHRKVPVISHESDMTLGIANKVIYHFCDKMCVNYETTAKGKSKIVCTGLPLIDLNKTTNTNYNFFLYEHMPTLLVIGGSLGSFAINETIESIAETITKKVNIIHIVGKNKMTDKEFPKNYNRIEFAKDIGSIYKLCDYAISRAGATTIFELLSMNIPMLLIPLSKQASRGDQLESAKYFENKNYALVLEQENLTPNNLTHKIYELLKSGNTIKSAQKSYRGIPAKDKIIDLICSTARPYN